MWLSRRKRTEQTGDAAVGRTTLEGETVGAYLDGERRNLRLCAPGGYRWRPSLGQELLVVKGADGLCVAGSVCTPGGLEPGEISLSALRGGAEVRLRNNGKLELWGDVLVNGAPLLPPEEG